MEATREIYWNITSAGWLYPFAGIALVVLLYGIQRRTRLWRLGRSEPRVDRPLERLGVLLLEIFGQRRLLRDPLPGIAHLLLFYSFLVLFAATLLIAVQEWSGVHFLAGRFYLWYSLAADSFGILGVAGLCMALWRRAVLRPPQLHSTPGDWLALALLLLLFLQGFFLEGARIAVTELRQNPGLAVWSPGGTLVALLLQDMEPGLLLALHRYGWWFHAGTAFVFIGCLGFSKLDHLWYGPLNIFLRSRTPSGKLAHADIEALAESHPGALDTLGVERIEQFGWKALLDLDACTNCGRCEAVCPAHLSGVPLNPRKLIRDMKDHLERVGPSLLAAGSGKSGDQDTRRPPASPPLFGEPAPGAQGPAVLEEEIWGCRTCGACQQVCPVHVEHVPKIVDMRRHLVMTASKVDTQVQQLLKNIDDRMQPWTGASRDREAWFEDLEVKVLGRGDRAEWLFWVGCAGSMIERNIAVSRAVARVLSSAGLDFGLLGAEEQCTGDPARRVGGELTFQTCAKQNVETLNGYGVRKIVTTCPHCFNSLKNEYPDFGGHYEVVHHSELMAELIRTGRLHLKQSADLLTYHDPCYLGRHNGVYDPPRQVLGALARHEQLVELPRNRSRSLCCGSGGGYAWMDDTPRERISHIRLNEMLASGARTAALSCPFCLQLFEDAQNTLDPERSLRTADLAELVAEALDE